MDGASVPLLKYEGYSTPSGSGTDGIEANLDRQCLAVSDPLGGSLAVEDPQHPWLFSQK